MDGLLSFLACAHVLLLPMLVFLLDFVDLYKLARKNMYGGSVVEVVIV